MSKIKTYLVGRDDSVVDVEDGALHVGTDASVDSNEGDNLRTSNLTAEQLLTDILKELKKINFHLSAMTDITIDNTEVE